MAAFAIAHLRGKLPVARDIEPIGRARLLLFDSAGASDQIEALAPLLLAHPLRWAPRLEGPLWVSSSTATLGKRPVSAQLRRCLAFQRQSLHNLVCRPSHRAMQTAGLASWRSTPWQPA